MSIGETLIILIIALLVLKPEDIPAILRFLKAARRYLRNLASDIMSKFDEVDDPEEINRYLEKIMTLGDKYEGEYDLEQIKKYYMKLLKKHKK